MMKIAAIKDALLYLNERAAKLISERRCPQCGAEPTKFAFDPLDPRIQLSGSCSHGWAVYATDDAAAPRRESVNHPLHYGGDVTHEMWKCMNAWGLEQDALLWNAVKYIGRAGKKDDSLEDLKKARWYLNKRIELMEAMCRPTPNVISTITTGQS